MQLLLGPERAMKLDMIFVYCFCMASYRKGILSKSLYMQCFYQI